MRNLGPLLEKGKSVLEILDWIQSGQKASWKNSLEETRRIFDPARELDKAAGLGIEIISFKDLRYPAFLLETADPPLVLYMKGSFLESDQASVAVVGSRHPSLYGREQAKRFAGRLAESGITIVSGFARGIDHEAHEGALGVRYGRTVAVLGSGLDVIYPREHRNLYEEIVEKGAVISEFALGTPPLAENFPKRNRIIAGLSLGVLVVEAHSRSGSLITAHLAAEEGREVFALPGRVDQLGSRGTHLLIKEGAQLVDSPEEVLEVLSPHLWPFVALREEEGSGHATDSTDSFNEEEEILLDLFEDAPLTLDQVASQAGRPVSSTIGCLTCLELKGAIRKRPDGRYERVSGQHRETV